MGETMTDIQVEPFCVTKTRFACGSMVRYDPNVCRFLRSQSAKNDKRKKRKYRSAEGWIANCVSPVT
jgi:hypothetical protein